MPILLARQPLQSSSYFKALFKAYLQASTEQENQSPLRDLFHLPPHLNSFEKQATIKKAQFPKEKREVLTQVLLEQHKSLEEQHPACEQNILKLRDENSFTVTTGHQLNLALGPMYVALKLLSVIKAAQQLNAAYPTFHFVPLYWMASEDHDIEEIDHFSLFGKTHTVEKSYEGVAGNMPSKGAKKLLGELGDLPQILKKAYSYPSWSEATRSLVQSLFGQFGLVTLDAQDQRLKRLFAPIMEEELFDQATPSVLEKSKEILTSSGFSVQANPREINLFYIDGNKRSLIEANENGYSIEDNHFTKDDLTSILSTHPERFSPNVITRPLYQEAILPNVAYVGGPGEISYWLQLKPLFDKHSILYPILLPRQNALFLNKGNFKRWEKCELDHNLLFEPLRNIKDAYLQANEEKDPDLYELKKDFAEVWSKVAELAAEVQDSLRQTTEAQQAKFFKDLDNLEKRIKKAADQKHETALKQIEKVVDFLFPDGGLQERKESLFTFYANHPEMLEDLLNVIDPFSFDLSIYAFDD